MHVTAVPTPTPPSDSPFKSTSGLRRIVRAAGYSASGLRAAYRNEHAFRQEVWLAVPLVAVASVIDVSITARALLIGSVILVLVVELLNSAIEAVVDRVSPEFHPLSKRAKDIGSSAVFLGLVNVFLVWGIVIFG
jgi:diacylglycerol kinase (ATP)